MTSTNSATATNVHDPSPTTNIDLRPIAHLPWLVALTARIAMRWSPRTRRQLAYALGRLLIVAVEPDRARDLLVGVYAARGGRALVAAQQHYTYVVDQAAYDHRLGEYVCETDDGPALCRPPSPYDLLARLGIDARQIVAESQSVGWRALTLAELEVAAAAVVGDRWVVDQLVPNAEVTVEAGAPKSGKSWLALYKAICVAAGLPVFGRYTVRQGPVLVIAEDDGIPEIEFRLRAIARGLGVDRYALPIRVVVRQRVRIDNTAGVDWIRNQVTATGARLVLLDSLSRLHGAEESSRSEMAPILDSLLYLADRTRVAILLVHHARKSGAEGGSASAALRGSSDLAAVARSVLLVDRGARGKITVDIDANYAVSSQLVVDAVIPSLDDADPVATFTLVEGAVSDSRSRTRSTSGPRRSGDLVARIIDVVAERGPVSRKYLIRSLGARDADVYTAVTALLIEGRVVEVPASGTRDDGRPYRYQALALPGSSTAAGSGDTDSHGAAAPAAARSDLSDLESGSGTPSEDRP